MARIKNQSSFEKQVLNEIDIKMNDIVDLIFTRSQERLIEDGKVDTSNLLKSGNVNRGFLNKEIVYSAPYAEAVEFGAVPHKIYSGWLEGWVRRRLGISDEKKVKSVAFAIAKTIEKRGMDASPFLGPSIDAAIFEFEKR